MSEFERQDDQNLYSFDYSKAFVMEGSIVIAATCEAEAWKKFWEQRGDIEMKFTGDEYPGSEHAYLIHSDGTESDGTTLKLPTEPLD